MDEIKRTPPGVLLDAIATVQLSITAEQRRRTKGGQERANVQTGRDMNDVDGM